MRAITFAVLLGACGQGFDNGANDARPEVDAISVDAGSVADADYVTIPRFSTTTHMDLSQVERISRFRSSIGHGSTDCFETCRSMKHYFRPNDPNEPGSHAPPWNTILVRSPTAGTIMEIWEEQTYGSQVHIVPAGYPDFRVRIFHVSLANGIEPGTNLVQGQTLGTHASEFTMSDVAVERFLPDGCFRLVSFFETMTDEAFSRLADYGINSRGALQISAQERDADPLLCDGEGFRTSGSTENWVVLSFQMP